MQQGCIFSPFLFLLEMDFVMKKVTTDQRGPKWKGKKDLLGFDLAEDIVLLAETTDNLQHLTTKLEDVAGQTGRRMSYKNPKAMSINYSKSSNNSVTWNLQQFEMTENYVYLEIMINKYTDVEVDVSFTALKVASVFRRMNKI